MKRISSSYSDDSFRSLLDLDDIDTYKPKNKKKKKKNNKKKKSNKNKTNKHVYYFNGKDKKGLNDNVKVNVKSKVKVDISDDTVNSIFNAGVSFIKYLIDRKHIKK